MEDHHQLGVKSPIALTPPSRQMSVSPPWEGGLPTMTLDHGLSKVGLSKMLPERPEPVYPPMFNRDLLPMKTLNPAHRDVALLRNPFYPFPPLPPGGAGVFPLPLHMQPFAAGPLLPKYLPFSPFLFHAKYPLGKKTFRCSQCRYMTDRKNNLKRHVSTMHQDCGKTLECCDIIFKSKAALRDHVLLFHRTGYKCRYCGRNFCRKALLKRHLAVHNGQKDFICSICDYATSHKSNLERHKKVHGQGLSGDEEENDYIPEPEELNIDVENDMDIEVEDDTSQTDSFESVNITHDPILESTPLHTTKRSACHKGQFCLSDRLRQTHEDEEIDSTERSKDIVKGIVPNTNLHTKESFLCNDQLQRSSHLQDLSSKVKIGGHKRLFANPYKCSECTLSFPAQHQLAMHALMCIGEDHAPVSMVGSSPRGPEPDQPSPSYSSTPPAGSPPFTFSLKDAITEVHGAMPAVTCLQPGTIPSQSLKSGVHPERGSPDHNKDTWPSTDKPQFSPSRSDSPPSDECNSRSLPLKKRCINTTN